MTVANCSCALRDTPSRGDKPSFAPWLDRPLIAPTLSTLVGRVQGQGLVAIGGTLAGLVQIAYATVEYARAVNGVIESDSQAAAIESQ